MSSVRILAPAKVNLGLAILGKRADGYHEIDTIMAMIDLTDEITISRRNDRGITIGGMIDVPVESNLMTKAALAWTNAAREHSGWHIEIAKRIPSPAGIGGGSSDAAAVLRALNALHGNLLPAKELHDLAAEIGADCPFFLGTPAARATGIGTNLRPLGTPEGWVVLGILPVSHGAKTATLYGALTPDDYGTSAGINAIEKSGVNTASLPNSFMRPVMSAFSGLPVLHGKLTEVAGAATLSGAGPALYAISKSESEANAWADQLREQVASDVSIIVTRFLKETPQAEVQP